MFTGALSKQGRRSALVAVIAAFTFAGTPTLAPAQGPGTVTENAPTRYAKKSVAITAKKKKKTQNSGVATVSSPVGFLSGTTVVGAASCPGRTHLTGGGFANSPAFSDPSGLRSIPVTSHPTGETSWTSSASAFNTPSTAGTHTTYARCEGSGLGQLATLSSGSVIVPPSSGQTIVMNCPPGTHVLSGGYMGDGPTTLDSPDASLFRIVVLASRRTGVNQWTVVAFNRTGQPSASLTGYALCERDRKGSTVSETSATTLLFENLRAGLNPSCGDKQHVVSGGFQAAPASFPAAVTLVIGVDETHPLDNKVWKLGVWEHPNFTMPTGASMTAYAYCKSDPKKQKKKKKGRKK